jgi:hypothetical protein
MRKLRARRQLEEGNGMGSSDYDKMEPAAAQKQAEWSKKMRVATSDSDGDDPHPPHSRPSIRPASPYARRPNIPSAPSGPDWFTMQNALFELIDAARAANLTATAKPSTADAVSEK